MTRLAPIIFAGLILGGSMAVAALAQDTFAWSPESRITLQPTSQPGAVAEVVFLNTEVHTAFAYAFPLTLDGLTVSVAVEINADGPADRFTVMPPEGFIAWPESLVVPENGAGVIYIMDEAIG